MINKVLGDENLGGEGLQIQICMVYQKSWMKTRPNSFQHTEPHLFIGKGGKKQVIPD